jgi:hypothetical protein
MFASKHCMTTAPQGFCVSAKANISVFTLVIDNHLDLHYSLVGSEIGRRACPSICLWLSLLNFLIRMLTRHQPKGWHVLTARRDLRLTPYTSLLDM